jgi:hypothetical protein
MAKIEAVLKSGWEMARMAFLVRQGREPSDRERAEVLAADADFRGFSGRL